MIPLIDVALILLIIFMVLTPVLMQSQINVQLPKSSSGTPPQQDNVIKVEIAAGGGISVEGKAVNTATLERELTLRLSRSSKKTLIVQADKTVDISRVVQVLDVAKKLGVGKLGIGVSPK